MRHLNSLNMLSDLTHVNIVKNNTGESYRKKWSKHRKTQFLSSSRSVSILFTLSMAVSFLHEQGDFLYLLALGLDMCASKHTCVPEMEAEVQMVNQGFQRILCVCVCGGGQFPFAILCSWHRLGGMLNLFCYPGRRMWDALARTECRWFPTLGQLSRIS